VTFKNLNLRIQEKKARGDNNERKWNKRQTYRASRCEQERTRAERAKRLFVGRKLSSDLASVMKRDARNSATVFAVAPRFNSSAWRARVLFLSHLRPLFLSLFISAGGMTERVLSSRYAARATPRRSFCRWQLRDTKWAAHSVSHACRGFDARIARSAASRRSRPPQAACVVRMSPGEVTRLWHDTPMSHRLNMGPIRLE